MNKGIKHYYCNNPECQAMLKKKLDSYGLPVDIICPNYKSELELSEDKRISKKVHCTECEALIDFNYVPPKILNKQNYVELL